MMRAAAFLLALAAFSQPRPMLPDRKLTPGATDPHVTQSNIRETICKAGYTSEVRSVPDSEKREVMRRYGLPLTDLRRVEIDHFLSLELGGANTLANLWPEYYHAARGQLGYLGARKKDVVETNLHRLICGGQITLSKAQADMWHWPKVYREIHK